MQPNHAQLDSLNVQICSDAIKRQLNPASIEVSIAGDMSVEEMKPLAMVYLGSVPPRPHHTNAAPSPPVLMPINHHQLTGGKPQNRIGIYQSDSDERAMGYVAGPAPNNWGVTQDGQSVVQLMKQQAETSGGGDDAVRHRNHPAFAFAALKVFEEVRHFVV